MPIQNTRRAFRLFFLFLVLAFFIISAGTGARWLAIQAGKAVSGLFGIPEESKRALLLGILLLVTAVNVMVILSLLVLMRWRKPVVFISFKRELEEKARELQAVLAGHHFRTVYFPFDPGLEHDEVVMNVRNGLRKADALIAVPHAEDASFVDAEIMGASVRRLPIVVLQYQDQQKQPTTLLRGFPVFDYARLTENQFIPLIHYLRFATRHPQDYGRFLLRFFKPFLEWFNLILIAGLVALFLAVPLILNALNRLMDRLLGFSLPTEFQTENAFLLSVLIMLIAGYWLYLFFSGWQILNLARQISASGTESFEAFEKAFSTIASDRKILLAINRNQFTPRSSKKSG